MAEPKSERQVFIDQDLMSGVTGQEPLTVVSDLLSHTVRRYRAAGGVVFSLNDATGHLDVYVGHTVPTERIEDAVKLWPKIKPILLKREEWRDATEVIAPLHLNDTLYGMLFLDFVEHDGCRVYVDSACLRLLCTGLSRGLKAGRCKEPVAVAMSVHDIETMRVLNVLKATRGDVVTAASAMSITRNTVYRYIRSLPGDPLGEFRTMPREEPT